MACVPTHRRSMADERAVPRLGPFGQSAAGVFRAWQVPAVPDELPWDCVTLFHDEA